MQEKGERRLTGQALQMTPIFFVARGYGVVEKCIDIRTPRTITVNPLSLICNEGGKYGRTDVKQKL